MKKRTFIAIMAIMLCTSMQAQTKTVSLHNDDIALLLSIDSSSLLAQNNMMEVKPFEFEIKAGTTYPLAKQVGSKRLGPDIGLEARWNLKKMPLDLAVEMNFSTAVSKSHGDDNSNRMYSWAAVADYNFNRGQKVSPFIGLGLGCADCDVPTGWYDKQGTRFMFMPRVGVELFHHLRLTLDTRFAMKKYNTIGLTVGYVFGGGLVSNH